MDELKPCPFCGCRAELRNKGLAEIKSNRLGDLTTRWEVVCPNCGTKQDGGLSDYFFCQDETLKLVNSLFDGRKKAVEAWNRRA